MVDLAPAMPASSSATPTTCHPLPRYKGKQIDNTDLLDSIDWVGTKLAETLALVRISWSHLLLKGTPFVADQPPQRVSGSPSAKP